jgi:hypothetical protein
LTHAKNAQEVKTEEIISGKDTKNAQGKVLYKE